MDLHMEQAPSVADQQPHSPAEMTRISHLPHLQQQHPQAVTEAAAGQPGTQLTPTVQSGLEALNIRKQGIHAKIDELGQVMLEYLEQTRVNFLQWMENYKKMLDDFSDGVVQNGTALSTETIEAQLRLGRAQQLVSALGLEVMNPQVGAEDITGA